MRDSLVRVVRDFLLARLRAGEPLLLGYSGGPDSQALLHLLLECRRFVPFELHLAHVDHGWRAESAQEAEKLGADAQELQLPFHLRRLEAKDFSVGNLEEQARMKRLAFFKDLQRQYGFQAILLAHQADDYAEVVLKRLCEGSHFSKLGGIAETACIEGMTIWRPLRTIRKRRLIAWLKMRKLTFFSDPTNVDSQFLRGRMRQEILPSLAAQFGKEIVDNLCYLGESAEEIRAYFLKKISAHLPEHDRLELPAHLTELELQFLLKEWFVQENLVVSRTVFRSIFLSWINGTPPLQFVQKNKQIQVKNKTVFIVDLK